MEKKNKIIIMTVITIIILVSVFCFFILLPEKEPKEKTIISKSNSMLPGIKLGDELVYNQVSEKSDIISWVEGKNIDYNKFEDYGDVVIYQPYGQEENELIIHRVICWVDYNEDEDGNFTYNVLDYAIFEEESITIDELGLVDYKPSHSGYITKGDNNNVADQISNQLCNELIKIEWILGKCINIKD